MDCSEIVPNFITVLNKKVLITIFELLLFLAIETRVAAGKSFHAIGPATANPRFCIDDNRQRLTTRQSWSADRKCRLPGTAETSTQSSCRYNGALWLMQFATSSRILNFIRCAAIYDYVTCGVFPFSKTEILIQVCPEFVSNSTYMYNTLMRIQKFGGGSKPGYGNGSPQRKSPSIVERLQCLYFTPWTLDSPLKQKCR